MNLEKYAEWVWQRHDPDPIYVGFYRDNLREACEGVASEGGELLQCQRKLFYERIPIPPGEFLLEAADVLHYLMLFCKQAGVGIDELAAVNICKLQARDIGRQQDFEILFRTWKPEKETLKNYLKRMEKVIAAYYEGGDGNEPMQ